MADRRSVYDQESYRTIDVLQLQKNMLYANSRLAEATFGQSTFVVGLNVTAASPANLTVNVNPGQLYQYAQVDSSSWSDESTDTTLVLQQGLLATSTNFNIPIPATSGYSQYYLLEGQFQQLDANSAVLPYYNSANPSSPLNGPGNTGAAQNQDRLATVNLVLKAGVAAPTGAQVKPVVDTGFITLGYVLVVNGQSTITSANISDARPMVSTLPAHEATGLSTNPLLTVHGIVPGNGGNLDASTLGGYPASAFLLASATNLTGVALLMGNNTFTGTNIFSNGINPNVILHQQLSSDPASPATGESWYNVTDGHFRGVPSNSSGSVRFLTEADMHSGGIIDAATLDGLTATQIQNAVISSLGSPFNSANANFQQQTVSTNGTGTLTFTFTFNVKFAVVAMLQTALAANGGHAKITGYGTSGMAVNANYDLSTSPGNGQISVGCWAFG